MTHSDDTANDLPEFRKRKVFEVLPYANRIFTAHHDGRNHLAKLLPYPDGHFRAIFHKDYFEYPEGTSEPSKSQWNTLKKKFKRHNHQVFVFRQVGIMGCNGAPQPSDSQKTCYYIDFGFYLY